jgi:hypothetical protein
VYRFDDALCATFAEFSNVDSQTLSHTHEIVAAMQDLYNSILCYGEQWTSDLKEWLLRILAQKMMLPIEDPEALTAVVQCLTRYCLAYL